MKVVVFGGREYQKRGVVFRTLDNLHAETPITLVIEGGARGADRLARNWAKSRRVPFVTYEAEWENIHAPGAHILYNRFGEKYNVRAGTDRNQRMLDHGKPDFAVGFPGGRGTADMWRRVKKAGIEHLQMV